jgi:hypothetical protein
MQKLILASFVFHKDTFSATNELPLSSICFTVTPPSLCEHNNEHFNAFSCFDQHLILPKTMPMSTNEHPISCACTQFSSDIFSSSDRSVFTSLSNFRKTSIVSPIQACNLKKFSVFKSAENMTIAIYACSCSTAHFFGKGRLYAWTDNEKLDEVLSDTLHPVSQDFDNFLNAEYAASKRNSFSECNCNFLTGNFPIGNDRRRFSAENSILHQPISSVSSEVFYKVANFMRIRENFENTILNYTTKMTNPQSSLLANTLTPKTIENPIKSQPKLKIHNSDTSSSSHSTSSVRRQQRHSIASQMSYFKMLGLGGIGKKMAASTSSLFSTAVISGSGSSSAPNLRDMIPNTAAQSGKYNFENILYVF